MRSRFGPAASSGFAGRISRSRVRGGMDRALATGLWDNGRTNERIVFDGLRRELWSFRGRSWFLTGTLRFWHYETLVLAVDFDKDMVTDFGYSGFTPTTTTKLTHWMTELRRMPIHHMISLSDDLHPLLWTRTVNYPKRGAGYHEDMWQRFRAGVPWAKRVDGAWWFHGPSYRTRLVEAYEQSRTDCLSDGVSWHWFTYDWDSNGQWAKRFIDADAERRWNQRQARRAA